MPSIPLERRQPSAPLVTPRATMRAAVLAGPREVRFEDVPMPDPGPGQVRVRVEGCGVAAMNALPWGGRSSPTYPMEPGTPGHEAWGVVDVLGDAVQGLADGTRVAFLGRHGFAEFDLADANHVVPLPAHLDEMPFPGEPLGCAMNIITRSDIEHTHTVAIVGAGFIGTLVAECAAHTGARVIAISRRNTPLERARAAGAAETLRLDDPGRVTRQVMARTGGRGCDRVIECVGRQESLDLAGALVAERGRLVVAGHHDGPRAVDMQRWNDRGIDVINAHARDPHTCVAGIRAAVRAVTAGRLHPAPLYTHVYPLEQLAHAFAMLEQRPEGFMKALVMT